MIPPDPQRDGRFAATSARPEKDAPKESVAAVVLCGGRSSRMGRDKAQLDIAGKTMLSRALAVLDEVSDDVRIACGPSARYEDCGRELVLDRASDLGPLGGLEAALADTASEYVVALACDMPRVDAAIVRRLVDTARSRGLDVCCLRSARGIEPLCGVWKKSMAHPIRAALESGERRVIAPFDEVLADGTRPMVGFFDVEDSDSLRNVNTPADLESTVIALTLPLLLEAANSPPRLEAANSPPRSAQ